MRLYLKGQAIDHENPKLKSRVKHARKPDTRRLSVLTRSCSCGVHECGGSRSFLFRAAGA